MGGDETNKWLDRTPTTGDAKAFAPWARHSGIDVTPDGVKLFSTQAEGETMDFQRNLASGVNPLLAQPAGIGHSFLEAEHFAGMLSQGIQAMMLFNQDVGTGLSALNIGAQTIATLYVNADTTSAATLSDVLSAFDISKGKPLQPKARGTAPTTSQRLDGRVTPDHLDRGYSTYDPHAPKTIKLGDGSYTVPGDGADDLERVDQNGLREVNKQFRDDLAKVAVPEPGLFDWADPITNPPKPQPA